MNCPLCNNKTNRKLKVIKNKYDTQHCCNYLFTGFMANLKEVDQTYSDDCFLKAKPVIPTILKTKTCCRYGKSYCYKVYKPWQST